MIMPDYHWTGGDLPNFVSHLECGLTGERHEAGIVQGLSKAVSLPGVGDKAVRDGGDATSAVSAIKGSQYCRVAPGDGEVPGYALEAAAVATLCNRIFGRGNTTPDLSALMANASAAATSPPSDQGALPSAVLPTDASSS